MKITKDIVFFAISIALCIYLFIKPWPMNEQAETSSVRNESNAQRFFLFPSKPSPKTIAIFFGSAMTQFQILNLLSNSNFFESISVISDFNPNQIAYSAYNQSKLKVNDISTSAISAPNMVLISIPWWPFYDSLLDEDFVRLSTMTQLAVQEIQRTNDPTPVEIKLIAVEPFINAFEKFGKGGSNEWKQQLAGMEKFLECMQKAVSVSKIAPLKYSIIFTNNADDLDTQALNNNPTFRQTVSTQLSTLTKNPPSSMFWVDRNISTSMKSTLFQFLNLTPKVY